MKASNVQNDDEDDEANKPSPEDAEKPEFKYLDLIRTAANNPLIDIALQDKIKKEFTADYELQYHILAGKDLLSDAEKLSI